MKRMNEVFELPVDSEDFTDPCYPNENAEHVYIAHAINNVDSLADALAAALQTLQYNRSISERDDNLYLSAVSALNAYRGAE